MENNRKMVVAVVAALVLLGGFYWAMSIETKLPPENPQTISQPMSYMGNSISEEKDGKKVWDLTAEKIEIDPVTKNTILINMQGFFYQEDGSTIKLVAPHAIYKVESREVVMTDKVEANASDGTTLQADEVQWKSQEKIFIGKGNVKISQQDAVLTGDVLESDSGMKRFKMSGNAHIVKGGKKS